MELYDEYLNSNEFNIYEINHLKDNNMDDAYMILILYSLEFI